MVYRAKNWPTWALRRRARHHLSREQHAAAMRLVYATLAEQLRDLIPRIYTPIPYTEGSRGD